MAHVKECYYFSHDSNARSDPKIMAMLNVYGMEGYGRWWTLIEILRERKIPGWDRLVDRIVEMATAVRMEGKSYRMRGKLTGKEVQ